MTANSKRNSAFFVMARKEHLKTTDVIFSVSCELSQSMGKAISIHHGCIVLIEKYVTDRHHQACQVMPNSDNK